MISLILYGRNDSHGYNLHKRAAISLNAMAEVLSDPDDEIIFVDYNTPDDLPTFVEAIGDTLSAAARERVRILRVRPSLHEQFRLKTHLMALEPISRNVALRRSNPANRWVLSTNTDMIFTPHEPSRSLTDIVADLEGGFYQLPRFELPESLWESFDRKDGAGIIARTRELATRFHLNEIVYGSNEVLFDGPGDFQLCLRDDLVGIHGFHEGMLRGWHVDANLCARMIALRGEIKSLAGSLAAYHCDHTRQATSVHKHDRVENDAEIFVDSRADPRLPEQADTWGLPDEPVEEIKLGHGDVFARYLRGLESAISEPQAEAYESAYRSDSFGGLTYRHAHVLPFVLDVVAAYPAGTIVLYAGARADMGAAIANALKAMGAGIEMIVPEEFDWLQHVSHARRLPLGSAFEDADILVLEFGAGEPRAEADADAKARLAAVRRALITFAPLEKTRIARGEAHRRVLAINAIHNEYESLVTGLISYTLTPYSTHLRHGVFLAERPPSATTAGFDVRTVWRDVQTALRRTRAIQLWETQELMAMAKTLAEAPAGARFPSDVLVSAQPLMALLRHKDVTRVCDIALPRARAIANALELERPGFAVRRLLPAHAARTREAELTSLSRVADMADWESERFAEFVDRHFGGPNANAYPDRNPWTWERAAMLDALAQAGLLRADARVLLVSTGPDALAPALADYLPITLARARGGSGAFIAPCSETDRDPQAFDLGHQHWRPGEASYDAIIFLQQSIMLRGPRGVGQAMKEAAQLVRPGGLVLMSAGVTLVGAAGVNEFWAPSLVDGSFADALRRADAVFEFCGPLEAALTRVTCDRVIDHAREDLRYRRFVTLRGRSVSTEAMLAFRRTDADGELTQSVLARIVDIGLDKDIRFQIGRAVRLLRRIERRIRWELDRRRRPRRRR